MRQMSPDLDSIRATFKEQVERRRQYGWLMFLPLFALLVCLAALAVVRNEPAWIPVAGWLTVLCWLTLVALIVARPGLACTNCRQKLDRAVRSFCPECGSRDLEVGRWVRSARCAACGKRLVSGRGGRSWKIRTCTFCGVVLDEAGV
jgi:ribosomal protein S27E